MLEVLLAMDEDEVAGGSKREDDLPSMLQQRWKEECDVEQVCEEDGEGDESERGWRE